MIPASLFYTAITAMAAMAGIIAAYVVATQQLERETRRFVGRIDDRTKSAKR